MIARFSTYYRVWRSRGASRLDHSLWFYWALFGKYPAIAAGTQSAETGETPAQSEGCQSGAKRIAQTLSDYE